MQCACVALAFLCLSSNQQCSDLHQSNVIDKILEVGTELYKLHFPGQSRYLLASELPLTVDIKGNVTSFIIVHNQARFGPDSRGISNFTTGWCFSQNILGIFILPSDTGLRQQWNRLHDCSCETN